MFDVFINFALNFPIILATNRAYFHQLRNETLISSNERYTYPINIYQGSYFTLGNIFTYFTHSECMKIVLLFSIESFQIIFSAGNMSDTLSRQTINKNNLLLLPLLPNEILQNTYFNINIKTIYSYSIYDSSRKGTCFMGYFLA